MQYQYLLERVRDISSIYNLAGISNAGLSQPIDYQEVARAMRDAASKLFGELVDDLPKLEDQRQLAFSAMLKAEYSQGASFEEIGDRYQLTEVQVRDIIVGE